jgi:hypothetical protein
MGEYQAVLRLHDTTKRMLTPLIQIPEIGYDFKEKRPKGTLDEHLKGFVLKKIYKKWGGSFCFLDLRLVGLSARLENGIHPVRYVFDDLRETGCSAIPVTGLDRDRPFQQEIRRVLGKDERGACLRLSIQEAAKSTSAGEIDSLLSTLYIKHNDCDLVLDLGAPDNFEPLGGFAKAIQAIVSRIPNLKTWRTFSVLGTSVPDTMSGMKLGVNVVRRYEWELYKVIIANFKRASLRLPTFGDYAISHPTFSEYDMRLAKPSAKIRYTADHGYYIVKGRNIRDERFGKNRQYHNLSKKVIESQHYCGSGFSWGDEYVQQCANGGSHGSLTTWVTVDTNHHIEKVTQDIANFYASASNA